MSKVSGSQAIVDEIEESIYGALEPGIYAARVEYEAPRASDVDCPYCHQRLDEEVIEYGRVKYVADDETVLMDWIPDTYRVLSCEPCAQVFTQPKPGGGEERDR